MCGICGIFSRDGRSIDPADLIRMNDRMYLRGPDDAGTHVDSDFGMAMRRLSIIDLTTGHQPISNDTGKLHIVFNGEIYNFRELHDDLVKKGYRFKTRSDTEVILHLYEEYGEKCVDYLNGMFAFCIWNETTRTAWIARDRLGIKPLYYFADDKVFAFSSSLDSLLCHPRIPRDWDWEALELYLNLSYVPSPRTPFRAVTKLAPGHWMKVTRDRIEVREYWNLRDRPRKTMGNEEFLVETAALLREAVQLQSRTDVPVGNLLSGGIDSSLVTAMFCQVTGGRSHSYSVDFEGKAVSDLPYAKLVADRYDTYHHPFVLGANQSFDLLNELTALMDEPIADSAIVPSYFLAQRAREDGIKVLLCGAGGDEVFAGYHRHVPHFKDRLVGKMPKILSGLWPKLSSVLPTLAHRGVTFTDPGINFALNTSGIQLSPWQRLMHPQPYARAMESLSARFSPLVGYERSEGLTYGRMIFDVENYLRDNVLSLFDKATMAASVEGRVPLLDHRLVEHAFSVTPEIHGGIHQPKSALRRAFRDLIPGAIWDRPKTGFNGPVDFWMKGEPLAEIRRRFAGTKSRPIDELVDRPALLRRLDDPSFLKLGYENVFNLYVLDRWSEKYA